MLFRFFTVAASRFFRAWWHGAAKNSGGNERAHSGELSFGVRSSLVGYRRLRIVQLLLVAALAASVSSVSAFDSWVERRDSDVVKQQLDYSCGVASLATLHNLLLAPAGGVNAAPIANNSDSPVTELDLLSRFNQMNAGAAKRGGYTLADLRDLGVSLGWRAVGVHLTAAQLETLKIPAMVQLNLPEGPHFSVLKPASQWHENKVALADPSWGNQRLSRHEFLRYWLDGQETGVALVLLPQG